MPGAKLLLTCPFHIAQVEQAIEGLVDDAEKMIHDEFGAASNNALELGFAEVWRCDIKRHHLTAVHFRVCVIMGLLRSNVTAMRHVMGEDYCWQEAVLNRLGLPAAKEMYKNDAITRETKRTRTAQPEYAKQSYRRKHQGRAGKKQRAHISDLIRSNVTGVAAGHDGSPEMTGNFDVFPMQFLPTPASPKVLLSLDINGTLLKRTFDPTTGKHGVIIPRPHLKEFLLFWQARKDVDLAVWCGATTEKSFRRLLDALVISGLKEKCLKMKLRSFDQLRLRGPKSCFKGTTKVIVLKPARVLKSLAPQYQGYLQVDDDVEKMTGRPNGAMRNKPSEYYIIPKFDGDLEDNCLSPSGGEAFVQIQRQVALLKRAK